VDKEKPHQIPFKVYYRDGSTYVGQPENAPVLGVALVVQFSKEHGREKVRGEYYTWYKDRWLGCGYDSMISYMNEPGWKKYLVGVMLPQDDWDEINRIAENDPDFPPRTAQTQTEKNIGLYK